MSYSASPLADLLDRFGSGAPVPGGGPAAGIAAALGTSLVVMAATLAQAREPSDDAGALTPAIVRLRARQAELLSLADSDSVAYAAVLTASRLPKTTPAEKDARGAAIEVAMEAATAVPIRMMQACGQVLADAVVVTERVPGSAHVDLAIGIELIDAALRGCGLCVAANAGVLATAGRRRQATLDSGQMQAEATVHLERIRAIQNRRVQIKASGQWGAPPACATTHS